MRQNVEITTSDGEDLVKLLLYGCMKLPGDPYEEVEGHILINGKEVALEDLHSYEEQDEVVTIEA